MKEEEDMKKQKERQAFLENIYVLVCMILIVALAVVIVIVKINIFQDDPNITFVPLSQQVTLFITFKTLSQLMNVHLQLVPLTRRTRYKS